jgi:general secretion pathway protein M
MSTATERSGLAAFWAARSRRERLLLAGAAALGLLVLLGLALVPAWRSLQAAPQAQARLSLQWQRMQALQAEATALQGQPRRAFSEAALQTSLLPLGETAQLTLQADGAELRLQHARPEALALWLLQSRTQTGTVIRQAQLEQVRHEGQIAWNGRLLLGR